MNGLKPQIIIDKNGHTKTVWVSPDNAAGVLASNRNRIVASPPQSRMAKVTLTSTDIENWIDRNNLPLSQDEDFVDLVNANIVASGDFSDANMRAMYDNVFIQNFGGYTVESLRAALSVEGDKKPLAISSSDPRVQSGELFDAVEHDGIVYHRRTVDTYPTDVYSMRFQFSRELDEKEAEAARDLIAYAWAARVRGEPLSDKMVDSPYSFVLHGDSTKSRSDDVGVALEEWEGVAISYLMHGIKRSTKEDIPPLDSNIQVEIYYDNVGGI